MAWHARAIRRTVTTAASAALILAVGACGGTQSTTARAAKHCVAPGVTPDRVTLGLLYPDTGLFSTAFAAVRAGVDARIGVVNSAGGVYGRRISYTWRDDASTEYGNLAGARDLVKRDHVFGAIETTAVASGSGAFFHSQGVPVTGLAAEPVWSLYDNMFTYVNFLGKGSVSTWGDYTAAQGGKSALILWVSFNAAMTATNSQQVAKIAASLHAAGVAVVGSLQVSPQTVALGVGNLGAQIKASHADTIIALLPAETFDQTVVAAHAAGVPLKVAMSYAPGYDSGLLHKYGRQIAGASYYLEYSPFELNRLGHREFLAAVRRYSPQLQPQTAGGAVSGWLAADMMIRGLQAAGPCPTRQRFITALRAVKNYNADGLLPSGVDMVRSFGRMTSCFTFVRVSPDGTRFEVAPPVPRCGRPL